MPAPPALPQLLSTLFPSCSWWHSLLSRLLAWEPRTELGPQRKPVPGTCPAQPLTEWGAQGGVQFAEEKPQREPASQGSWQLTQESGWVLHSRGSQEGERCQLPGRPRAAGDQGGSLWAGSRMAGPGRIPGSHPGYVASGDMAGSEDEEPAAERSGPVLRRAPSRAGGAGPGCSRHRRACPQSWGRAWARPAWPEPRSSGSWAIKVHSSQGHCSLTKDTGLWLEPVLAYPARTCGSGRLSGRLASPQKARLVPTVCRTSTKNTPAKPVPCPARTGVSPHPGLWGQQCFLPRGSLTTAALE